MDERSDAANEGEARRIREAMERVDRLAELTDNRFRIPGTPVRFGLDSLVGLIPGVGDLVGVGLSLWLYSEAWRMGAPGAIKRRMLGNIIIDFLVGLVPLLGDVMDVAFKANVRNRRLLRDWLERQLVPPDAEEGARSMVFGGLALLVFTAATVGLIGWLQPNGPL